jgi:hypothetical protein
MKIIYDYDTALCNSSIITDVKLYSKYIHSLSNDQLSGMLLFKM